MHVPKRHYAHIKKLSTLICDHTLHHGRKHFLHTFSTKQVLKRHIKDCLNY